MINGVSNIAQVSNGTIEVNPVNLKRALPDLNSLVKIEVLEPVKDSTFRITVNGSVFIANLPILAKKGDEFFANVFGHNPFTLKLDGFSQTAMNNLYAQLLTDFGLDKNILTKEIFGKINSFGKSFSKAKMKRFEEFLKELGLEFDENQLFLLVNLIWNDSPKDFDEIKSVFKKFFSTSFENLVAAIYQKMKELNTLNLPNRIYDELNKTFMLEENDYNNPAKVKLLKSKDEEIVNLMNSIDSEEYLLQEHKRGLNEFFELIVKYQIQKEVYSTFNVFPDFIFEKNENDFAPVIYFVSLNGNSVNVTIKFLLDRLEANFAAVTDHLVLKRNESKIFKGLEEKLLKIFNFSSFVYEEITANKYSIDRVA